MSQSPGTSGLILAIETSNPSSWEAAHPPGTGPGVALAMADLDGRIEVIDVESIDPARLQEDLLGQAIDALTRRQRIRPNELRRVVVSAGPGGFTSIRVAVTTAKFIAEATGAECCAVPTALVAAHAWADRPVAVALASKGATAWLTVVHVGGPPASGRISDGSNLSQLGVQTLLADRFLPATFRRFASDAGITIEPLVLSPSACAVAGAGITTVDPVGLLPLYPREPEAVTKWRELHPQRPE